MRCLALLLTVALSAANDHVDLVTFDGAPGTTWSWKALNDPVMGGVSFSTFSANVSGATAKWVGQVNVVPSLKAPGFCNAETTDGQGVSARFNDASAFSHIEIKARAFTEYSGYKVSFAADTINPQFKSFKANFELQGDGMWRTVAIPLSSFSNDWSTFTGDCDTVDPNNGRKHTCCSQETPEVCPTRKNLKDISQVGLWMEGHAGKFDVEIAWVRAGFGDTNSPPVAPWWPVDSQSPSSPNDNGGSNSADDPSTQFLFPHVGKISCEGPVQSKLRYNMSARLDEGQLPVSMAEGETLAEAICCDTAFSAFAEPIGYYNRPDVNLFAHLKEGETAVFYDSVCGIPLFKAPIGRTIAEFRAETEEHGWPSFRTEEIVTGNVHIVAGTERVVSSCGTHLGSNLPDEKGDRYCMDLACIS